MGIADELITRGWAQRTYRHPDGSVCLEQAAACAFNVYPYQIYENGVAKVINELLPVGVGQCIAEWNDAPERTFDEVLRVAKEADEILGL